MTQTALDWFNDELDNILELKNSQWYKIEKAFIKAKEMEKQQIMSALKEGVNIEVRGEQKYHIAFERYYKEKFEK